MAPLLEGGNLQEAIRTTLTQLCKIGLSYQSELRVEGTLGVTVDSCQVILVHFAERVEAAHGVGSSIESFSRPSAASNVGPSHTYTESVAYRPEPDSFQEMRNRSASLPASSLQHMMCHGKRNMDPVMSQTASSRASRNVDPVMAQTAPQLVQPLLWYSNPEPTIGTTTTISCSNPSSMPDSANTMDLLSFDEHHDESGQDNHKTNISSIGGIKKPKLYFTEKQEPLTDMYDTGPDTGEFGSGSHVDMKDIIIIDESLEDGLNLTPLEERAREFPSAPDTRDLPLAPDTSHTAMLDIKMCKYEAKYEADQDDDAEIDVGSMGMASVGSLGSVMPATSTLLGYGQTVDRDDDTSDLCGSISLDTDTLVKGGYHPCKICGKILISTATLDAHLVETHDITNVNGSPIQHQMCPHCNKKFRFQATLDKHLFLHVSDKPYRCQIQGCSNAYKYSESLSIHEAVHLSPPDEYRCKPCNKIYSSKQLIQKHIVYMHEMRRASKKDRWKIE